jgi:hypothetical protein
MHATKFEPRGFGFARVTTELATQFDACRTLASDTKPAFSSAVRAVVQPTAPPASCAPLMLIRLEHAGGRVRRHRSRMAAWLVTALEEVPAAVLEAVLEAVVITVEGGVAQKSTELATQAARAGPV